MTGHRRAGSGVTGALGLHTDLYELRMVESYLRRGMSGEATFSLFVRPSTGRPWHVALGVRRVVELLERFAYGPEEIAYLEGLGIGRQALDWLASFEPAGELWAVPDGTIVLADEPILEFTGPLPAAQLLETAVMNLVQLPTMVATKAARLALAADGRSLADFGFRRAQGLETGVEAAWAAWVGGGLATSNVEAGRRYGLRVVGTMAHSFVQSFPDEEDAFRAFAEDHPDGCILLVDTYDTLAGVRRAIEVAGELRARGAELEGIRLDSGDLDVLSRQARELLDEAGFADVRIFASGGLDEDDIRRLVDARAPIDAYGVGSSLVVSKDQPSLDIVYKLVAYEGRPRAKFSGAKSTLPHPKQVFREDGFRDVLARRDEALSGEPLLVPVWRDGRPLRSFDDQEARTRVTAGLDALPEEWVGAPGPAEPPRPRVSEALRIAAERLRAERVRP